MQSEKQIAAAQGVLGRGGVYVGAELIRAALEAALPSAEPIGYVDKDDLEQASKTGGPVLFLRRPTPVDVPIYAAPPAPSVAVKAVAPVDVYKAFAPFIENDTFDKDHVTAISRAVASTLSAQVQDVAGELSRINDMMEEGDDDGSPILPEFGEGWSVEAKVAACLHLLEKRRDVIEGFTAKENWQDDPAQDERWNAGFDFAVIQLCKVLKVDPKSINWDCATETLEGDAQSQIHKVLAAAPAKQEG
ncbi:hypothetical protein [Agrobacterium sp. RC10-4-1]|uniref:hypothetical protein n=1 Tax=Agrobacterium sp. RC10-4-1 TaxID=2587039 RepID=UPI001AEEEF81|nr:hypothetical protein [Agrobacterium sp. RC10-4-1]